MEFKHVDFSELQSIAQQSYNHGIELRNKTNKSIEDDIRAVNESCPCEDNGICSNIQLAIPFIQGRYALSDISNSISKRKLLIDDITSHENTGCDGRVIFFNNKPCAFFLMSGNVILRFIATGESSNYPISDMFALLLKHGEYYIYTDATRSFIEAYSGSHVTEITDLSLVPITDRCESKKLFQLKYIMA